ncbi:hypothetical protein ACLBX9_11870 [Methylobacterium sp. A49B]|nr:hypothetical protein [Methylobacterium mesophilicum]
MGVFDGLLAEDTRRVLLTDRMPFKETKCSIFLGMKIGVLPVIQSEHEFY